MEVEIPFDLAPFLTEEMWQEKAGPESTAEPRQESSTRGGAKASGRMPQVGEKLRPDLDVTVFDRGKAGVHVALLRIGLDPGQGAIQERGVGLVLPVVLESVDVWLGRLWHAGNMTVIGGTGDCGLGTGDWGLGTGDWECIHGNPRRHAACQTA